MSKEKSAGILSRLGELSSSDLRLERHQAQRRVWDLQQSFSQLRSGGCAMETLIEEARTELELIEELLKERGEDLP